jgi:hypothetical protein
MTSAVTDSATEIRPFHVEVRRWEEPGRFSSEMRPAFRSVR